MWNSNDDDILKAYFGYKHLVICPNCGLLLADIAELRREHRNAGAFPMPKKQLFKQCKFYLLLNIGIILMILSSFSVFKDVSKYNCTGWQKMISNERMLNRFRSLQVANGKRL